MSVNRDVNKKVREQTNEVAVHLIVQLLKSGGISVKLMIGS